jgi:hypothetical protein
MKRLCTLAILFAALSLMPVTLAAQTRADPATRATKSGAPGPARGAVLAPVKGLPVLPPGWSALPGEFALRTQKGFYVTAIDGGGRVTDPIVVTAASSAGTWEKFRIWVMTPPPTNDKSIQTPSDNYLTAVDGGGRTTDVLHTDATQVRAWEQFRVYDLSAGGVAPTYFALQTISGNYLTAVGEGGKYEDAIHTDASQIGAWEHIRIVKCGDLGSGFQYTILPANEQMLTAVNGGGLDHGDPIVQGYWPGDTPDRAWARFTLIRQSDGSYGLQTANGVNYVTALGGGGKVQQYLPPDCGLFSACLGGFSIIFHTDATQVRAWEQFKFIDQGDCKYAIQTVSGYYVGIFHDSSGYTLMTTDRSTISENEKFQLIMYGLASPVVLE